jgi:hypothetical protein
VRLLAFPCYEPLRTLSVPFQSRQSHDLCENNSPKRCLHIGQLAHEHGHSCLYLGTKVGKENRLSNQPKMEFETCQLDLTPLAFTVGPVWSYRRTGLCDGQNNEAYMRIGRRRAQRPTLKMMNVRDRSNLRLAGNGKVNQHRPTSQPFLAKVVPHRSFLHRGTDLLHFPTADEM